MNCPAADRQYGTAHTQAHLAQGTQTALPAGFRLWLDLADRAGVKFRVRHEQSCKGKDRRSVRLLALAS